MERDALYISGLNSYYGKSHVIHDLALNVEALERVVILGRNGMGKTTLLRSILGIEGVRRSGTIRILGRDVAAMPTHEIARIGFGYVPQDWKLFPSLSVREHLRMAFRGTADSRWTADSVLELFPELKERLNVGGTMLSGGEQQMLSISRALVTNPSVLAMDEPSEGLSQSVIRRMTDVCLKLGEEGISLLLVEQNLDMALKIAERVYVMLNGQLVHSDSAVRFREDKATQRRYLGI